MSIYYWWSVQEYIKSGIKDFHSLYRKLLLFFSLIQGDKLLHKSHCDLRKNVVYLGVLMFLLLIKLRSKYFYNIA